MHMRKQFPDTLSLVIKESEPFALLDMKGHLFLVDEKGNLLEELRDDSIPFLPVIGTFALFFLLVMFYVSRVSA